MFKPTLTVAALAVAAFARPLPDAGAFVELNSVTLRIEHEAGVDDAVLILEADSDASLLGIEVRHAGGDARLRVLSAGLGGATFSGIRLETGKTSLAELRAAWPEGPYRVRSRTEDGDPAGGGCWLSHALPREPQIASPAEGALVDGDALLVSWASDPNVDRYRIVLEQDDNDGLVVDVPGGKSSFAVPPGLLVSGVEAHVEVGAIAANGNCTSSERSFTPR